MRHWSCTFAILLLATAAAQAGENYAFLVAVSSYDRTELNPLTFTQRDVRDFAAALRSAGYPEANVVVMHDDRPRRYLPERDKIWRELDLLLGALSEDDSLIVAFSGHGVSFAEEGASYFCPIDARLEDRNSLVRLDDVYAQLARCKARRRLLLIDACRNDPLSNLARSRPVVDLQTLSRPQREAVPEGIVALFSCAEGQRSYEHPHLSHGVFFHHVLAAFQGAADDGDGELTVDELIAYARKRTQDFARQELAVSQTPYLKGEFAGTWVLRKVDTRVPPPTQPVAAVAPPRKAPTFDLRGRWVAKGNGYTLEHEFLPDGRCQWWMRSSIGGVQLAHWSGRVALVDGHYQFTGDDQYPGTFSQCVLHWHGAGSFTSTIVASSHSALIGATHVHYRAGSAQGQ